MTTIVPATVHDSGLLARIGSQSLIESHGSSASVQVMQSYVNEKFTEAALSEELADENNFFHFIYHNGQPAGYSKIIFNESLEHLPVKNITKLERLYLLQEYYDLNSISTCPGKTDRRACGCMSGKKTKEPCAFIPKPGFVLWAMAISG